MPISGLLQLGAVSLVGTRAETIPQVTQLQKNQLWWIHTNIASALYFARMIITDTQHFERRILSDNDNCKMEKDSKNNQ